MKKVLLIAAMALGVMFTFSSKASAQFYSGDGAMGAIATFQIVPNNPFQSMAAGVRAVWEDCFGPSLGKSMAGMFADTMILDSMNSAMSPYGGKMSALPTRLQNEIAALNLGATAYGLENQMASGSSKVWASLNRQEKLSLKTDAVLASMSGN